MTQATFLPTGRRRPITGASVAIALAAAAVLYGIGIALLIAMPTDSATAGVAQYLVAGLAPLLAVAIVLFSRVHDLPALGIRSVAPRWIFIAIGAGVGVIVLNILIALGVVLLLGPLDDIQTDYAAAASGGPALLLLTLLAGAVLTPVGEEWLFRGVVTNWLLRFGGWVAVPVSAAIFAVSHGINLILPVAFVVGVITALLFRATASIWPGVIVHASYNGYSIVADALVGG
ncbi:CPBP family intramembrane glutamic endopeptidase [Microbacterium timonense]|uniref:CPBP family intramembrane glutamic endopeptidase n=1 Tax=Microbacterium timonense TaxID=2086576 RepID=UPI000D10F6C8|nr:CPBP family intramembrane glutamic endopeptidase [Microbacterium timonense]